MNWRTAILAISIAVAGFGASAFDAAAQATRTWVSGVGDDANPCSRTAPCKTFAGAISKTAAGGEISVLDPGGFGAVTITKAITINGEGTLAGVLASGTNGININAGENDVVVLRKLDINGAGSGLSGINFLRGKALFVEDCQIRGFVTTGINVTPNQVITGANAGQITIRNTSVFNNQGGMRFDGTATTGSLSVAIIDSEVINSSANGIQAIGDALSSVNVMIERTTITQSTTNGLRVGANAIVRLGDSVITNNGTGLLPFGGGQIQSYGTNQINGNAVDGAPTGPVALQ